MGYQQVQTAYKLTTNIPGLDGDQLLGEVTNFVPPVVAERTEDYTNGTGMVREIDLGLEKLESRFTLQTYRKELFGAISARKQGDIPTTFTFYSSLAGADGAAEVPQVQTIRGHIKGIPTETVSENGRSTYEVALTVIFYSRVIDNDEDARVEVDLENVVYITGGVDRWAQKRANLRIGA